MGSENTKQQMEIMKMIAFSGNAKKEAFDALAEAKKGKFVEAEKQLEQAVETINRAHGVQQEMMMLEASQEEEFPMTLLLIHAEDHLMTTLSTLDLIKEIIELYRRIEN